MTELIDTTEMYLRTVYELTEEGVPPLRARIAERLGHSGPTVSQTIARMERDGLLAVADDRRIELSEEGRRLATRVMRKHRLAELLLLQVIGLEWEYVHDEACRWEHVMSERVERKILALLGEHRESPFGNPIPGLDELEPLGTAGAPASGVPGERPAALADVALTSPVTVVVRRIGEPVQVDQVWLARLVDAGIRPGRRVTVRRDESRILVRPEGASPTSSETTVPEEIARHVLVAEAPS